MSETPKTVAFVAGATGYTGRHLVDALLARQVEVWAHVRPDSPSLPEWSAKFSSAGAHVDTTPWQLEAMCQALARVRATCVFALLGTTRARARAARARGQSADYQSVDYGLTALLIDAAQTLTPPPRFIYLSSVGADSTRSAYMEARRRVEAKLRASSMPYVVARPSFITGPDRDEARPAERLAAALTDGAVGLATLFGARGFATRYHSTTGEALARALVHLALDVDDSGLFEGEALQLGHMQQRPHDG